MINKLPILLKLKIKEIFLERENNYFLIAIWDENGNYFSNVSHINIINPIPIVRVEDKLKLTINSNEPNIRYSIVYTNENGNMIEIPSINNTFNFIVEDYLKNGIDNFAIEIKSDLFPNDYIQIYLNVWTKQNEHNNFQ